MKVTKRQSGTLQGQLNHYSYSYSPISNKRFHSNIDVQGIQKSLEKENGNEELSYQRMINDQNKKKQCLQVRKNDDDKI